MRLFSFKLFQAVVDAGSVSAAARILHMTQPAITSQVRNIELDLGVQLLTRSHTGVTPTPQGQILYNRAVQFTQLEELMRHELATTPVRPANRFRLLTGLSSGANVVPHLVAEYRGLHPDVEIEMEAIMGYEVPQRMASGEADVAVTSVALSDQEYVTKSFYDEPLDLAGPKEGLVRAGYLWLRDLCELPLVIMEPYSTARQRLEQALAKRGLSSSDLNVVAEVRSNDALMAAVRSGTGLGFLPRTYLQGDKGGMRLLQVCDLELARPLHIARRRALHPASSAEQFVNWVMHGKARRSLQLRFGG